MENSKENVDFIFFHYASQMFSWLFFFLIMVHYHLIVPNIKFWTSLLYSGILFNMLEVPITFVPVSNSSCCHYHFSLAWILSQLCACDIFFPIRVSPVQLQVPRSPLKRAPDRSVLRTRRGESTSVSGDGAREALWVIYFCFCMNFLQAQNRTLISFADEVPDSVGLRRGRRRGQPLPPPAMAWLQGTDRILSPVFCNTYIQDSFVIMAQVLVALLSSKHLWHSCTGLQVF